MYNPIGENLLSPLNEENQPVHVNDNLVPLEDHLLSMYNTTYHRRITVPIEDTAVPCTFS